MSSATVCTDFFGAWVLQGEVVHAAKRCFGLSDVSTGSSDTHREVMPQSAVCAFHSFWRAADLFKIKMTGSTFVADVPGWVHVFVVLDVLSEQIAAVVVTFVFGVVNVTEEWLELSKVAGSNLAEREFMVSLADLAELRIRRESPSIVVTDVMSSTTVAAAGQSDWRFL